MALTKRTQEIPFDAPESRYRFETHSKLVVATPNAINAFGHPAIALALNQLAHVAQLNDGLDYLQVFEDDAGKRGDPHKRNNRNEAHVTSSIRGPPRARSSMSLVCCSSLRAMSLNLRSRWRA